MPPRPAAREVAIPRDTFLVQEDRVQLPRLYYSWPSAKAFHADDAALDLLAYVLAGDKNSRLYKRLVYEMQVAQDVSAFQVSGRLDGLFGVTVTPKPGQAPARMAQLVNEELRKLSAQVITYRAQFLDQLASVNGKADQLNFYDYFAGTPDYVQRDAARYDAVTTADVQRVAREYLGKPKVVLTVVPEGKPELMVKEMGDVRIP
jgi:zinc protease